MRTLLVAALLFLAPTLAAAEVVKLASLGGSGVALEHGGPVAFLPDGSGAVALDRARGLVPITVVPLRAGTPAKPKADFFRVAFAAKRPVALVLFGAQAQLWDLGTLAPVAELTGAVSPRAAALSEDGKLAALLTQKKEVELHELPPGKGPVRRIEGGGDPEDCLALSRAAGRLALYVDLGGRWAVRLLTLKGEKVSELAVNGHATCQLSADGKRLAVRDGDQLRLVETATGKVRWSWKATEGGSHSDAFAVGPTGDVFAGVQDRELVRLDGKTGAVRWRTAPMPFLVKSLAASPDGKALLVGGFDELTPFGADTGAPSAERTWPKAWTVALSADGSTAATTGPDRAVVFWDAATGARRDAPALRLEHPAQTLRLLGNGRELLVLDARGVARRYDLATGAASGPALGDPGAPTRDHPLALRAKAAAASPDGELVAYGDSSGVVRLVETATGKERWSTTVVGEQGPTVLPEHGDIIRAAPGGIHALFFAPDGRTLVVDDGATTTRVELRDGKLLGSSEGRPRPPQPDGVSLPGYEQVVLSTDGRRAAARTNRGAVDIFQLR